MRPSRHLPLLFLGLISYSAHGAPSPEDILATFEVHPDFTLGLAAMEPLVTDPVDMEFDERGDAYVLEMPGYPLGEIPGKIVKLTDTNGDGVFDTRSVFAEGFAVADSLLPYRGGMLVASPPDLLFLKDSDRDGKADVREVILTGFAAENTQHNFNGLSHGIDNWIYGANGGNSGSPHWPDTPDEPMGLRFEDFRIDIKNKRFERIGRSTGGFELALDAYGGVYGTHNLEHLQHLVFPGRYLDGVPAGGRGSLHNISDHEEGGLSRIYPIGVQETRVNHPEQSGYFSGACGITFYGGGAFPEAFNGNLFVADVVLNLIHRDVLSEAGPSYTAARGRAGVEFLASTDRAFRPVNLSVGPDGALYVIDMYRPVIEHPEWIPDEIEAKLDIKAGMDQGRIFRIVPSEGLSSPDATPAFRADNLAGAVAALAHPNKWWRDTAQRLLVEWDAVASIPLVETVAATSPTPLARIHALHILDGMEALTLEHLDNALGDPDARVREHAIRIVEPYIGEVPELVSTLCALAEDESPRVRMQAALTLGVVAPDMDETREALLAILAQDMNDPWLRLAVASAARATPYPMLSAIAEDEALAQEGGAPALAALLAEMIGQREPEATLGEAMQLAVNHQGPVAQAVYAGLADGLEERAGAITSEGALLTIGKALDELVEADDLDRLRPAWRVAAAVGLKPTAKQRALLDEAASVVVDRTALKTKRLSHLELLAFAPFESRQEMLFALLDTKEPAEIQRAAIRQLRESNDTAIAERLVERWRALGPDARTVAGDILLYKRGNHGILLSALEDGRIALGELNLHLERRRTLLWSNDESIRKRAEALFSDAGVVTRREVIEQFRPALELEGDVAMGREMFNSLCSKCHKMGDMGYDLAPNLTEISRKSPETLLHDILDPNAAVDAEYISYAVETEDGEFVNGVVAEETDESVTIRQALGVETTIPREKILSMTTGGLSIMPEDLETQMDPQMLADLLAYLREPQ